ncbi:Pentatricopeptide repeat-containing protein [Sesamum angolense]|uniref:Pentatricopeptide repeat-containing protein n=1 Tax=Sesamum angolense TaxID=2727404 RepID=A0AAE1X3P4_9LAMI|nr:Pentatricopeptide repeat-containing protein [Sesamum angolense]
MQPLYGVTPAIEHYACVIDMLGRAGKLEEAFELISNMSIKPNQVVWRALLAACRLHGNADLAEVAAQRVLELEPEHCGNYVLMSNIYGAAGRYEQVAELRHTMRQQDVKKSPGCSWIELSDGMHAFLNGDRSHPEEYFLYDGLDSLTACLRERGWIDRFEIPIFWFHFIINEISCCGNKVDDISSDNIKKFGFFSPKNTQIISARGRLLSIEFQMLVAGLELFTGKPLCPFEIRWKMRYLEYVTTLSGKQKNNKTLDMDMSISIKIGTMPMSNVQEMIFRSKLIGRLPVLVENVEDFHPSKLKQASACFGLVNAAIEL